MLRCRETMAEEINTVIALKIVLRDSPHTNTPILFAIRGMYQANSFRHAVICPKNVIGTLRSSEAGRRGRRPLPRLSPFSAKPKRRPHFGGEGHSRGAKTDPIFAPDTSPNGGGLENEACSLPPSLREVAAEGRRKEFGCYFWRSGNAM